MAHEQRGKGRPRIDDRAEVLAYITSAVNAGATVTDAAARGLTLLGYMRANDGSWVRTERRLTAGTLERRHREALAEVRAALQRVQLPEGTRYIGVWRPHRPTQFVPERELRRGRPRNKRTR